MKYFYTTLVRSIILSLFLLMLFASSNLEAQEHSVAREWNEIVLEGIRNDFAWPTVHARNLFHTSMAMYDAYAAYDPETQPYFLGRTVGDYFCPFEGVPQIDDVQAAQEEAISYAMYRILNHRYQNSPDWDETETLIENLMSELGYDPSITSTDYIGGTPAEFGNYIAEEIIAFGLQDGSNEINTYSNEYYVPVNNDIFVELPGNPDMTDPNRWQPISVSLFIDQSGNPLPSSPPFLSPEWGNVVGFATHDSLKVSYERDGFEYHVYHDPGDPPYINPEEQEGLENMYKWGHTMVSVWQSHNDPNDGVMWDISPASIGNITPDMYPETFEEHVDFYDFFEGGDPSLGYDVNPATGEPYEPQIVPRGDYARVLAEFWADGPDSETPPGHWFTILNYVSDHPMLEKRWNGEGEVLDNLEWDVRCYFVLGATMHDAAISAWSVKGWYDYARPVSAIRYMAEQGQCTDEMLPNYDPAGIPLIEGYVELVEEGDPLVGVNDENLHKIKLYSWRGPEFIDEPETDVAGVGWILADNWWPYQRPSFVTPPFAGYVSGHSTYSRAAAEVMTLMTGDEYFPGGMGIFDAEQNEFLVFEDGPSEFLELQWAKYYDASDQCSLSRIWGGIHPPADDIPGRQMGMKIGPYAFNYAQNFINANNPRVTELQLSDLTITDADAGSTLTITIDYDRPMDSEYSPSVNFPVDDPGVNSLSLESASWLDEDTFELNYLIADANEQLTETYIQITGALDMDGNTQTVYLSGGSMVVDTRNPEVDEIDTFIDLINDNVTLGGFYNITISFDEHMNTSELPELSFPTEDPLANSLSLNEDESVWVDNQTFEAVFDLVDADEELFDIDLMVASAVDWYGNNQEVAFEMMDAFSIDTKNPVNAEITISENALTDEEDGDSVILIFEFDEAMNTGIIPEISFPGEDPLANSLSPDLMNTIWVNNTTYRAVYNFVDANEEIYDIDVATINAEDDSGNLQEGALEIDLFSIDTRNPMVTDVLPSTQTISDLNVGAEGFTLTVVFDEEMDVDENPDLIFSENDPLENTLTYNESASFWGVDGLSFTAVFDVSDAEEELGFSSATILSAFDAFGNEQIEILASEVFGIDTRNPENLFLSANTYNLTSDFIGAEQFELLLIFDEEMSTNEGAAINFPVEDPLAEALTANPEASEWINSLTYRAVFDVEELAELSLLDIDVSFDSFTDVAGNQQILALFEDYFDIQITSVGIAEFNEFEGISVYPNPLEQGRSLNIEFGESISGLVYEVFDAQGRLIASVNDADFFSDRLEIDVNQWNSGMYILKLRSGDKASTIRVQKMR